MADILYEAQAILSRRDNSEAEMRAKLAKKKFAAADIEKAIAWLKEKKYLNDREFARSYAASILRQKAVGPKWIAMKLKEKKIAASTIEAAVDEAFGAGKEKKIAVQAAAKWRQINPAKAQDRNRLTRFLLSRGFSGGVVRELL